MGPSLSERDRSNRPPQGRFAPAVAGRLWRSLPQPAAPVVTGSRSGRSNGPFGRTKQLGLAEPGSWRTVGQGGVWPLGIVMVKPRHQRHAALLRTGIGARVGPLAQAGLDKPLGLAVGARRIWPGAFVFKAGRRDRRAESLAEIGRTVVGHNPLDGDAVPGKPAKGALEKAHRASLALIRQDLTVGQPRRVIDAHMQSFPADAVMAIDRAPRSPGDAMADPLDAPELLAIDMDQLAGPLALIAHHHRLRFERGELAQAQAAQNGADRGDRHVQLPRYSRAAHPLPALRGRAAVGQRRWTAASVARQPAIALPLRNSRRFRRVSNPPTLLGYPPHQQESTLRRQPRILVYVHPEILRSGL